MLTSSKKFKRVLSDIFELPMSNMSTPPTKRPNLRSGGAPSSEEGGADTASQIMTTVELEACFLNNTNDLSGEQLLKQNSVILRSLFAMMKTFIEQTSADKERIDHLESKVDVLKKQIIDMEYDQCKNKMRISGLEIHAKARDNKEDFQQTSEIVGKFLTTIGCKENSFSDAFRIPKGIHSNNKKPPSVLISFNGYREKQEFYANLANLKDKNNYKIQVRQDFPRSLKSRLQELEKLAFEKRKLNYFTSIRFQESNLALYIKKRGESYTKLDI